MYIKWFHQFTTSGQVYLEKRYFKILRKEYRLSTEQIRNTQLKDYDIYTKFPLFRNGREAEQYSSPKRNKNLDLLFL